MQIVGLACAMAIALACTACAGSSSSTAANGASQTTGTTTATPVPVKENDPYYDARYDNIELTGTLMREERTSKDTNAAWSAVVYWLVFDNSVRITFKNFTGNDATETFSRITVTQLEQYDAKANIGLSSITDPTWQPHVGERVTVRGEIFDTGNSHTIGYATFRNPRLVG